MSNERRSVLRKLFASATAFMGMGLIAKTAQAEAAPEKEAGNITDFQEVPLFSGHTKFGNMVFIAGKGAHVAPFEIKAHTEIVLKELEAELKRAGSSMDKVLKVSVFLNDIADHNGCRCQGRCSRRLAS